MTYIAKHSIQNLKNIQNQTLVKTKWKKIIQGQKINETSSQRVVGCTNEYDEEKECVLAAVWRRSNCSFWSSLEVKKVWVSGVAWWRRRCGFCGGMEEDEEWVLVVVLRKRTSVFQRWCEGGNKEMNTKWVLQLRRMRSGGKRWMQNGVIEN